MASTNTSSVVPLHDLARRLRDLNREVYASMPWGYRLAQVLTVLAGDSLDAFGRVIYAEFVRAVVRGMPHTEAGKPAFDLVQDVERKGADALPPGYGRPFASRAYKVLLAKFGEPSLVTDAMAHVMEKAARGKLHIANGSSLYSAETYVLVAVGNAIRDQLRARGRRREVPLVRERDDDYTEMDVEDPAAFHELERAISPTEMQALMNDLREVHPRAPEWLRARLDGDSGREIADEWGTTPSWVSKWQRLYLPQVKKLVEHRLRGARTSYSYDRRTESREI